MVPMTYIYIYDVEYFFWCFIGGIAVLTWILTIYQFKVDTNGRV